MASENTITVVTACDNNFALMLAALIKSIEVNHTSGEHIALYIVNDGISQKNVQKLTRSINTQMFSVKWLTMDEAIPTGVKLPLDVSTFPKSVYLRLFIPYFLPEHLNRVLYLDVDMIAVKDISELWYTDIQHKLAAGVVDRVQVVSNRWGGIANYKELGLPADTKLFNSGLLLFNPVLWREQNIPNKVLTCIKENAKYTGFPDQYGLNVVLANQWLELDPRWNCFAPADEKHPYIIHFIGVKPIYKNYSFNEEYRKEFYKYLELTDWKGFKPVSGFFRLLKKLNVKVEKKLNGIFG